MTCCLKPLQLCGCLQLNFRAALLLLKACFHAQARGATWAKRFGQRQEQMSSEAVNLAPQPVMHGVKMPTVTLAVAENQYVLIVPPLQGRKPLHFRCCAPHQAGLPVPVPVLLLSQSLSVASLTGSSGERQGDGRPHVGCCNCICRQHPHAVLMLNSGRFASIRRTPRPATESYCTRAPREARIAARSETLQTRTNGSFPRQVQSPEGAPFTTSENLREIFPEYLASARQPEVAGPARVKSGGRRKEYTWTLPLTRTASISRWGDPPTTLTQSPYPQPHGVGPVKCK